MPEINFTHVSDTHGYFKELTVLDGDSDFIIHTGDLLPDPKGKTNIAKTINYQLSWLKDHKEHFIDWLEGKPFLYVGGNHDMIDPIPTLKEFGIEAYNLNDKFFEYEGFTFYGFPYIPYINGSFNYEKDHDGMTQEINRMKDNWAGRVPDVLACHSPLWGLQDGYGMVRFGNKHMLLFLIEQESLPQAYVCGHVHQSHGVRIYSNMLLSNAATTSHNIILTK